MTRDEIKTAVLEEISNIAPEVELQTLDPGAAVGPRRQTDRMHNEQGDGLSRRARVAVRRCDMAGAGGEAVGTDQHQWPPSPCAPGSRISSRCIR